MGRRANARADLSVDHSQISCDAFLHEERATDCHVTPPVHCSKFKTFPGAAALSVRGSWVQLKVAKMMDGHKGKNGRGRRRKNEVW